MRALALDIGERRIGVAVGETATGVASPICVLPSVEVLSGARTWRLVLEDHEPEVLVCGLPKSMSGEEGRQAQRVRELAAQISDSCGIPLDFVDERLSSAEAKRILRFEGLSEKRMRGKVDMVAASLFLQTWLDAHRN